VHGGKGKWCGGGRLYSPFWDTEEARRSRHIAPRCECPGFVPAVREPKTAAQQAAQIAHDLNVARYAAATYLRAYKLSQKLGGCPHGRVSKRTCNECRRAREAKRPYRKKTAARMRAYRQRLKQQREGKNT
jgi:hypothetical protein